MKWKKKKENGLLPTLAFFSHSNKTLLLLSSAIALDGICVSIAVDALMTNSVKWQRKNEIMVALTVHQILHILCARAQVHCTPPSKAIFFLAPRDIINQKPLYADMNDGAEKNEATKISCFISYFLRASLLQMHEWSAQAHCKPLLHAPRIRVWNCFFFYTSQAHKRNMHSHTCLWVDAHFEVIAFLWTCADRMKNRQRRDCRYLCYVVVVAVDTAVKLKTKPWLATNNSSALI